MEVLLPKPWRAMPRRFMGFFICQILLIRRIHTIDSVTPNLNRFFLGIRFSLMAAAELGLSIWISLWTLSLLVRSLIYSRIYPSYIVHNILYKIRHILITAATYKLCSKPLLIQLQAPNQLVEWNRPFNSRGAITRAIHWEINVMSIGLLQQMQKQQ